MAFSLEFYTEKYYWEGADRHGFPVRLEIWQNVWDVPMTAQVIDGLSFIRLEVQGSQDDVTTPIVKTSLSFGLVDAPDLPCADGHKNGNWQEFFTPKATEYLVRLRRWDSAFEQWETEWSGFITPDSWQESLDYHGEITIVARDGLGTLENAKVDSYYRNNTWGLRELRNIIDTIVLELAGTPMDLTATLGPELCTSIGHELIDEAMLDVIDLEGENAYEVLEQILSSIGYCLRFIGKNRLQLTPIRNLPLRDFSYYGYVPHRAVEFYNGDLTKEPAIKQIIEQEDYGFEKQISLPLDRGINWGSTRQSYGGRVKDNNGTWHNFTSYVYTAGSRMYSVVEWLGGYGFFKRSNNNVQQSTLTEQEGENYLNTSILLASDLISTLTDCGFKIRVHDLYGVLKFHFGRPVELKTSSSPYTFARLKNKLMGIKMQIVYKDPVTSTNYYYDLAQYVATGNPWASSSSNATYTPAEDGDGYSLSIPIPSLVDFSSMHLDGELSVLFQHIDTVGDDTPDYGGYVPLREVTFEQAANPLEKNTVNTVNDTLFNKTIERNPDFAALSMKVNYLNAFAYKKAFWWYGNSSVFEPYPYSIRWNNENSGNELPLPAQVHKQLLMFGAQPMTILSGDCYLVDKSRHFRFNEDITYKGKYYILASGVYDILECVINGAILHEYITWEDLWENS